MIVVKLMGGLGNQLFQYAAGRRLASIHKTVLKLDTSEFLRQKFLGGPETKRFYELSPFNIQASIAGLRDLVLIKKKLSTFREKHFHFDPYVLSLPDNVYLIGFWQSEKYFSDVADIIRGEIRVKSRPDAANARTINEIHQRNSVALHIRRGDYVADPQTHKFHGVCPPDYYQRGIKYIARRVTDLHFYVFSDDPDWCKEHVKTGFPTTHLDHNGPKDGYEDLRLMSNCKHFIIANSSFSWWGAWLSINKRKIVVAPTRWFAAPDINIKDLLPNYWVRL